MCSSDLLESFGYSKTTVPPAPHTLARALAYTAFDGVRRRLAYFPALLYRLLAPARISREEFWVYRPTRRARAAQERAQRAAADQAE